MKISVKKFIFNNPVLSYTLIGLFLGLIRHILKIAYDERGILGLIFWLSWLFCSIFNLSIEIIYFIKPQGHILGHTFCILFLGILICLIADYLYRQSNKSKIFNVKKIVNFVKRFIIYNPMLVFSSIGLILQLFVKYQKIEYGLTWLSLVFGFIFSTPNELFLMINRGKAIPGQTIWVYLLGILISLLIDYYYRRNILKKKSQ